MKNELLVISSYPEKGLTHGKKVVGVASYAKNTLVNLKKATKSNITVFAEILENGPTAYSEQGIKVKRLWKRNNLLSLFNLALKAKYHPSKKVLFEFEFAVFGGITTLPVFLLILSFLKLSGKENYLVLHHVIQNMEEVAGHIGLNKKSFKTSMFQLCIHVFYNLLTRLVTKTIVFEEDLAISLKKMTGMDNIIVIPHAVETFQKLPTKEKARKSLNIPQNKKVAMAFGFIAHYKGTDIAVKKLQKSNWHLLIAGGPNPNHEKKSHYKKFIKNITKTNHNVTVTGFVNEKDIPLYFKAADVALFPYRTFMSSSGPLSIAYSTKTPTAFSHNLKNVLTSTDTKSAIQKSHLTQKDLILKNDYTVGLKNILNKKDKVSTFTDIMKKERSWKKISQKYNEALFS